MKMQIKKEIEEKIAGNTPVDSMFSSLAPAKRPGKKHLPLYLGLGTGALSIAIVVSLAASFLPSPRLPFHSDAQLTFPVRRERDGEVSSRSAEIYLNFVNEFAPAVFSSLPGGNSVALSFPDLFLSLALVAFVSDESYYEPFLSYAGASSLEELSTAAYEISGALGSLAGDEDDPYGGFVVSSLFVDPDVYSLKGEEELSSLYRDLERDYLASVFLTRPSSELLNSYVESIAPPGLSLPPKAKIREDVDVLASSLFLAYYRFSPGEAARYKSFYDGGYRFAYHQSAALSYEVPYVPFHNSNGPILVSKEEAASCFEGASINVGGDVAISFFLPEAGIMPDEIIADVVKGNYEKRASGHYMEPGSDYEWGYDLRAYFPYFKTQSNVDLMPALGKELPSFLQKGLIGRLLDEHSASSRIVESRQLSNVSFDYNGLAIASLTYHGGATEPAPSPYRKEIYFDRPFAYISNQTLNVGGERLSLPILGGYVVETNYL